MMLLLIALSAAQAAPAHNPTIVVTGQRIKDAEAALKACIARNCPPNEDIDATLRLAETQLLDGKYHPARTTLLASLRRNKGYAGDYPIPVSDLYRANGKVAAHLGLDGDYYRSTWGIYSTLKHGLPEDEHRQLQAKMEIADMVGRTRGHVRARYYYEMISREARKAGRPDIAAIADLRSAIRHLPPNSEMQVAAIRKIADLDGKDMRAPVLEAKLALARVAIAKGDETEAQKLQSELSTLNIKRPILIYSPPYTMLERELDSGSEFAFPFQPPPPVGGEPGGATSQGGAAVTSNLNIGQWSSTKRIPGNFEDMWADISFTINESGRVEDAKVVRSKGNIFWTKPLMKSLALRRYTPGKAGDPGSIRTERYTYTAAWDKGTATHLAERSPKARVEFIDLSDIAAEN